VSGFRRIDACRHLGWSDIPAFILSSDTPESSCALLAIADNSFERQLNPVEISRALYLLSSYFKDVHVQLKYATLLGLCDHRTHLEKIEKIYHLPGPIQDSILANSISLTVALDLSKLDPDAAVALSEIIDQLKIGLNKQRQLIVLFKEIALRENTTIPDLTRAKEIRQILDNTEVDRVQIGRQLTNYLKQRRSPAITQFGKDFQNQVKALKLGNSAALTPPRDFEGTTYALTLKFNTHAELKEHQSRLDRVVKSAGLKKILDGKLE
jgi:ParB family chromosome partitioning protein